MGQTGWRYGSLYTVRMCSSVCALCGGVSPSERARKCVHMCPVCVPFSIKAAIAQQAWFSTLPKPTGKPAPHQHESSTLSLRLKRLQSLWWWHLDIAASATSHIHTHLMYRCLKWPHNSSRPLLCIFVSVVSYRFSLCLPCPYQSEHERESAEHC